MNVSEAIRMKRAVRNFQDKPLPEDIIHTILNAGRRAQSSKNTQTWQFIAIQDKAILKALSECGTWAGHLAGAALGVAILTPDPMKKFQIMFDAGQAAWARSQLRSTNRRRRARFWDSHRSGICASRSRLAIPLMKIY
jgi:nitroreductase